MRNYTIPGVDALESQARLSGRGAMTQAQAALINAQANATPSLQPGSMSGTYYTPEQIAMAQKMFALQSGLIDRTTGYLDKIFGEGGTLDDITGGIGGGVPGGDGSSAGSFADYFSGIAGGMPGVNFSDIPQGGPLSEAAYTGLMNNLFAEGEAAGGMRALGAFNARPGMFQTPENLANTAAMLGIGTRAAIANKVANTLPSVLFQNDNAALNRAIAQTNVQNSRLNQNLQQGAMALTQRQQDIQNQLGQGRLAVDAQGNILRTVTGLAGTLGSLGGGGFGGGFGTPLSFSQSGPAGYIFPSSQYDGVNPPKSATTPVFGASRG